MAKTTPQKPMNVSVDVGEGTLIHGQRVYKPVQSLKTIKQRFLEKLEIDPPHDPAILQLGIRPKAYIS